jgi:hypothetical protein
MFSALGLPVHILFYRLLLTLSLCLSSDVPNFKLLIKWQNDSKIGSNA